jgi:Mn-containing catalase
MSVMIQYLFQGWNCRGPAKYRDMILDIATEEIGHVEMLATMVARLLEGADSETAGLPDERDGRKPRPASGGPAVQHDR